VTLLLHDFDQDEVDAQVEIRDRADAKQTQHEFQRGPLARAPEEIILGNNFDYYEYKESIGLDLFCFGFWASNDFARIMIPTLNFTCDCTNVNNMRFIIH
jgi:hypothetical protein